MLQAAAALGDEPVLVIGSRGALRDTALVTVASGGTEVVSLFPTGTISGTVTFADMPGLPLPPTLVNVFLPGTSEMIAGR